MARPRYPSDAKPASRARDQRLTLRLTKQELADLDRMARLWKANRNEVIVRMIEKFVAQIG